MLPYDNTHDHDHVTYIPIGELTLGKVRPVQYGKQSTGRITYQYYFSDIKYKHSAEIIFNFKHGNGKAVARIVSKSHIDKAPDFLGRVKLPTINTNDLLYFDNIHKKIVITEKDTDVCEELGCEIYIGVYSLDEGKYFSTNTFTLFIREDDTYVNILPNEWILGSLDKTERNDEYDYFKLTIPNDMKVNRFSLEFESDLCTMKVIDETHKKRNPNYGTYSTYVDKRGVYFISKYQDASLSGTTFSFAVSTNAYDGVYSSFYSFKISYIDLHERKERLTNEINSSLNELCRVNSEFRNCYFRIPIYDYDYVNDMYFHAMTEQIGNSNERISIYVKAIEMDEYLRMNTFQQWKALPSKDDYDFISENKINSNSVKIRLQRNEISKMVLITITTSDYDNQHIIKLLTSFHHPPTLTTLRSNSYELYSLTSSFEIRFEGFEYGKTYQLVVTELEGKGVVLNNKNNYNIMLSNTHEQSVSLVITPQYKDEYNMITVQGMGEQSEHFIFMIQCIHMNNIGNFNELRFENKERVLYLSNTFPLALYMEIPNYKFDSDVVIYTQFNIYDTSSTTLTSEYEYGDHFIELQGVITNANFISERKRTKEALPEAWATASMSYDPALRIARFVFRKEDLDFFLGQTNMYFYIKLEQGSSNKHEYKHIGMDVYSMRMKHGNAAYEIKPNQIFVNAMKDSNCLLFDTYGYEYMEVEFSNSNSNKLNVIVIGADDYVSDSNNSNNVVLNYEYEYNNHNTTGMILQDTFMYGKRILTLNNTHYNKIAFIIVNKSTTTTTTGNNELSYWIRYQPYNNNNNNNKVNEDIEIQIQQREHLYTLPSPLFTYNVLDNDEITFNFDSFIYTINNTVYNDITYLTRFYSVSKYKYKTFLHSLSQPSTPERVFYFNKCNYNTSNSFTLPYISQGEYYVDIEAIAYEHNDNYNPQFYIYEPQKLTYKNKHSHINNDINIDDGNDSSNKGIVFRCLLIFVFILVMLVLWMFRKIRYEKTKHRSEHIEYNKLYDDNKNYNTA